MSEGMLGRLPLAEVRGPVDALYERLASKNGERWLQGLKRFIRNEDPWGSPIWKTITLGLHKTPDEYREAFEKADCWIGSWGNKILSRVPCAQHRTEIDLVVCSVSELGLTTGGALEKIHTRGKERGMELCPAEVGPALRLAYKEQPGGERLNIAMEATLAEDSSISAFIVCRTIEGPTLFGGSGIPEAIFTGADRFVFVNPRK